MKLFLLIFLLIFSNQIFASDELTDEVSEEIKIVRFAVPLINKMKFKDLEKYNELKNFISKTLSKEVEVIPYYNDLAICEDILRKSVDIILLNSFIFSTMENDKSIAYVGSLNYKNSDFHQTICIVNKNSKINSLKDLNSSKIGLGYTFDFSSNIYPKILLKNSKNNTFHEFKDVKKLVYSLKRNRVYAAFVNTNFEVNGKFKTIYKSNEKFPNRSLIISRLTVSDSVISKLKNELLKFNSNGFIKSIHENSALLEVYKK